MNGRAIDSGRLEIVVIKGIIIGPTYAGLRG